MAAAEVGRGLDPLGGAKRGKRGRHSSYNKRCAKCNCKEEDSRKRFRLCGDRPDCRRWVHKSHCLREFNTFELPSERCCRHQDVSKSACCCIA